MRAEDRAGTRRVPANPPCNRRNDHAIGGATVMVREGAQPAGAGAVRPDARPSTPTQVQASYRLGLLAIAAGLFETALAVVEATSGDTGSTAGGTARGAARPPALPWAGH